MSKATAPTLYLEVAGDLRAQIASGTLKVGDPIPSAAKLASHYGYSITVVRRAIETLRNEGLLQGQPGKAVYVRATPTQLEAAQRTHDDLIDEVGRLRAEVAALTEQISSEKLLRSELAKLRGALEQLYDHLGQPYPASEHDPL